MTSEKDFAFPMNISLTVAKYADHLADRRNAFSTLTEDTGPETKETK